MSVGTSVGVAVSVNGVGVGVTHDGGNTVGVLVAIGGIAVLVAVGGIGVVVAVFVGVGVLAGALAFTKSTCVFPLPNAMTMHSG
jgi:hypothetical protein